MAPLKRPYRRIGLIAITVGAVASVPVGALALTQAKPSAPSGATRVREFAANIDGTRGLERIFVFNLNQSGQSTTYLTVWHQRAGRHWTQSQYSRVFGPSPGKSGKWPAIAIAGDLNNDRRYEVGALDFVTPSVGEVLTILRQSRYHGLRFKPLQSISREKIARAPSMPGSPTVFAVTIKANHSPDGRVHNERWAWSKPKRRWVRMSGARIELVQVRRTSATAEVFDGTRFSNALHRRRRRRSGESLASRRWGASAPRSGQRRVFEVL